MIEINNLTNFALDKKLFTGIAKNVLKGENKEREKISLAFVSKEEIKKLNKKYRGKNKPTDVLSFELGDPQKKNYLGEVVICPEIVKDNTEMARVFVHGILHLCGYDHEKDRKQAKIMREKERHYFKNLKFKI